MNYDKVGLLKLFVVILLFYIVSQVPSVLFPIILSIVLAFLLNPLVNFLCRASLGFKMPRSVAILTSFIIAIICFVAVGTFIFMPFVFEFNKFMANLPNIIERFQEISLVLQQQVSTVELSSKIQDLINKFFIEATSFSVDVIKKVVSILFGFATKVIEFIVIPVLTFYFLKDYLNITEGIVGMFSPSSRAKVREIALELGNVMSAYIRGQLVVSMIIGTMVFIGVYFLGVDYPLVLGLLATLTELIPIIGPIIGAVPAIILGYLVTPILAFKIAVFYIVIHQIENHVVVPNVMGQTINVHPIYLIISLLIGGQLLGIVGMILAVPFVAIVRVLLKHLW